MRTIIFDFNRTIFNPESRKPFRGVKRLLRTCRLKGFQLILLSRKERGRLQNIKESKLDKYFSAVIMVPNKNRKVLRHIITEYKVSPSKSYVVGDRIREEIVHGNAAGLKTIWVRRGKFSKELPRGRNEEPTATVKDTREVIKIIR